MKTDDLDICIIWDLSKKGDCLKRFKDSALVSATWTNVNIFGAMANLKGIDVGKTGVFVKGASQG